MPPIESLDYLPLEYTRQEEHPISRNSYQIAELDFNVLDSTKKIGNEIKQSKITRSIDQLAVKLKIPNRYIKILRLTCSLKYNYTNRQIARKLKLSENTVQVYRADLKGYLKVRDSLGMIKRVINNI